MLRAFFYCKKMSELVYETDICLEREEYDTAKYHYKYRAVIYFALSLSRSLKYFKHKKCCCCHISLKNLLISHFDIVWIEMNEQNYMSYIHYNNSGINSITILLEMNNFTCPECFKGYVFDSKF